MNKPLAICTKAVKSGGAVIKRFFAKPTALAVRDDDTITSSVNVLSEKKMLEAIHRGFSHHSIYSSEAGAVENDPYDKWLIEPLDETVWMVRGVPWVGCAAAFERRSVLETAAVFLPMQNQLFVAERGKGATLNGKKIRVSKRGELEKSLIYFDDFRAFIRRNHVPQLELLIKRSQRSTSAPGKLAGLMAVAHGDVEAMVGSKISPATMAAARLIIIEAGGQLTDYSGKPTHNLTNFIASNGALHEAVLSFFGRNNSMNL